MKQKEKTAKARLNGLRLKDDQYQDLLMSITWETQEEPKTYLPAAPLMRKVPTSYDIFKLLDALKLPTIHYRVPESPKPELI